MEFVKGEEVEWIVSDKAHLILSRQHAPPDPVRVKKNDSLLAQFDLLLA
jgi:hypothetical protein